MAYLSAPTREAGRILAEALRLRSLITDVEDEASKILMCEKQDTKDLLAKIEKFKSAYGFSRISSIE